MRSSRNGPASLGQRAVSPQPHSALRPNQPASPRQAEFVLCEQTIFAMSSPIVITPPTDAQTFRIGDTANNRIIYRRQIILDIALAPGSKNPHAVISPAPG